MRGNNFDFLRLALALLVVRCHGALVGLELPLVDDRYFLGGRSAVECFFVISGFLIFRSWELSPKLGRYAEKRARRILPAYVFVVLACAMGLCLVSELSARNYFTNPDFFKYVGANLVFLGFLQNSLPGVFTENFVDYVNGPLWTIKIEVMFYVCVPVIAMLATRTHRAGLFALIYILSLAWKLGFEYAYAATERNAFEVLAKQLPGQMCFFIAGGALHYYQDAFMRNRHRWFAVSVIILVGHFTVGLAPVYPAALAVAVIYFANYFPYLGNFARFGDFSYGLYIYHYPILQIVAAVGLFAGAPWLAFTTGVTLAMVASYLSWHFLERPMLPRSSHYVKSSETEKPAESETATMALAMDQNP